MTTSRMSSMELVTKELAELLKLLCSPQNEIRSAAETALNTQWISSHPDKLMLGLANIIQLHQDQNLRSFAAVLFRRISLKPFAAAAKNSQLQSHNLWLQITDETKHITMQILFSCLTSEDQLLVLHKICDTVSEISKFAISQEEPLPDLVTKIFELTSSAHTFQKEAAFRIIASVPTVFAHQNFMDIKNGFINCLQESENIKVRLAAVKAAVAYLLDMYEQIPQESADLLSSMLIFMSSPALIKEEDLLVECFNALIELANGLPKAFRSFLPTLVGFCCTLIKNKAFEEATRQSALELVLSLVESSPAMFRKPTTYVDQIVPVVLDLMAEFEDDEEWYTTDNLDEQDNDAMYIVGEQSIDRLAISLGGNDLLPPCFHYIPEMFNSGTWQIRHAGLMAISSIGEGCEGTMSGEIPEILRLVLPSLRDQHPRVRHAACNCIGQLSSDFPDILPQKLYNQVLPVLIPVMDDSAFPRVQSHAAAALVNFSEAVSKEHIEPYLDTIFQKLLVLLNSQKTYLQEQAITTIATVADCAEEKFSKYYDSIMPILMSILNTTTQKEYRLLRGKAMECASLIALAVGMDVFRVHSREFIDVLMRTQASITDPDDPQSSYLLSSWARLGKVMGPEFVPFLPVVIPPLFQSASLKPDFTVLDKDSGENEKDYPAEDGWQFVSFSGQKVGIKTSTLEEKCTAVEMLICYARELGASFQPYVEKTLEIVVPLLKFYFHDGVREATTVLIPFLFKSMKLAEIDDAIINQIWSNVCDQMLSATESEPSADYLARLYGCFYECTMAMGDNCFTASHLNRFTSIIDQQLRETLDKLNYREERRKALDHDDADEEVFQEEELEEDSILTELSRAIHGVFEKCRTNFMSSFEALLPVLSQYMAAPYPSCLQWALCIFDDLIEFTGPLSYNLRGHFLDILIGSITHQTPDVRQAACYGIGLCAEFGGKEYAPACTKSLPLLFTVVNEETSKAPENIYATENAISAIGKICKHNHEYFDASPVIKAWLEYLPITKDEEESIPTYGFLCDLIQAQNSNVLGATGEKIPRLLLILLSAWDSGMIQDNLREKVAYTVSLILRNCPEMCHNDVTVMLQENESFRGCLAEMGISF